MTSFALSSLTAAALLLLSTTSVYASKQAPVIGFSIDDLRVERWTHDRDYFVEAAQKLGASVNVQSANANEAKQIAQIENLIAQNVDALVIVPFNSKVLSNAIASAKKKGIRVVSYDRLILNADVDAYISFDNEKIGEMQAQALVKLAPKGNYFLLGGASTDNNSRMFRAGQMKVLQPLVDKGDIKIVGQQWTPEWDPMKAQSIVENALTANGNNIQGIVASNDGTAGGAIQALNGQKLAGKVPVSGQDADLAGVRRVAEGTQAMTVYKPIKHIASSAAQMAITLIQGGTPKFNTKLHNGKKDVDTMLLTPTLLTKETLDIVIQDGFYTRQQIFGK